MTIDESSSIQPKSTGGQPILRLLLGLIFIAPAAFLCLIGLVLPTIATVTSSLQKVDLLSASEWVGGANYTRLFEDEVFFAALNFTLSLVGVRLLVVAILPLLLAFAVNEFGRAVRVGVRLLFTIPLALFGPVAAALVWFMALSPQFGLFGGEQPWLANPERAGWAIRLIEAFSTFGLACGVGLIIYLAALRASDGQFSVRGKALLPVLFTWLVSLLATVALTLPEFALSYVLTNGGPANTTVTLGLQQYKQGFQFFQFGPAAAIATLTLAVLALTGLIAGGLIIGTGLRLEVKPLGAQVGLLGNGRRPLAIILLLVTLLISLSFCAIGMIPFGWTALTSLKTQAEIFQADGSVFPANPSLEAYRELGDILPLARLWVNTLAPPVLALLWQIPVAYAGALGIGAVRPLGKRSEWLLLPFSPWLFVTVSPLILVAFQNMREAGTLNSLPGLPPPILISVPILFILALFFKGQDAHYQIAVTAGQSKAGAFFTRLIVPSLPLVALLAAAALLINFQALLWPLVVANTPEYQTFTVALLMLRGQYQTAWPIIAAGVTLFQLPMFLFFFLVFGLLQLLYLDRLVLRI